MGLNMKQYQNHKAIFALAAACVATPARAALGDSMWKFFSDFAVTVVEPAPGFTSGGSLDLLVGSQDDSIYLVETKGAGAGKQAWSSDLKATLSSAAVLPDINGDGRPDAVAGDELGLVSAISGADGKAIWKFLTFGTVLSLAALPDVNGDGVADVAMGSEDDTVYCLSGKPGSALGKSIWEFPLPSASGHPHGPGTKIAAPPSQLTQATGANALALIGQKNKAPLCLAVGTNVDTVYCLTLADGGIKWKTGLPGDIWKVTAFPDQDGDGVDELLLACGADAGYLLNGATGAVIWSHSVTLGATSVAAAQDMDGDGKPDALIGDGNGTLHCVPGKSTGANVPAAWTYSFGDGSTIVSIAVPGDLDKDGRADCVVGTSNDSVALIGGKGNRMWAKDMGGQVNAVAAPGDLDGDNVPDWVAGTETGFAEAFSGEGSVSLLAPRPAAYGRASLKAHAGIPLFARPGSGLFYDGRGRAYSRSLPAARREGPSQ
jgi:hypothetical protein